MGGQEEGNSDACGSTDEYLFFSNFPSPVR